MADQFVTVEITAAELKMVERNATETVDVFKGQLTSGGGRSHFRSDRETTISEDGLVGQVAALAGCKWLYGNALGHYVYRSTRWASSRAPLAGDGGCDVPGSNIDFKGSLIRNAARPLGAYHLPVRPRERHPSAVYVRVLVGPGFGQCFLVGWATDEDLPDHVEQDGVFEGAYVLPVSQLHPCPPFMWTL